ATSVEQAVGRIVGSLCVLTAKEGERSSAMLASWVAQASFNPPGLTIAVSKDRAVETLTHTGNKFVLNILKEGNHLGLMKHFLKPFGPGQDRFADVAAQESESGSPILTDALAYLECSVQNRMESGDHWLVYATVESGKLLDNDGVTAVHHRKSATHY
ncbi:MAG: flavin reductase family protein, partial [Nostoc sp.]